MAKYKKSSDFQESTRLSDNVLTNYKNDNDRQFDEDPSLFILNENNIYITKEYIEDMLRKFDIAHTVKNLNAFQVAMTHVSYLKRDSAYYETNKISKYVCGKDMEPIKNPAAAIPLQDVSYERMEFLGDSVIHHILAEYFIHRYEKQDEGFMTRLRTKIENGQTLAGLTKVIGLNKYVLLSKHMENNGSREKNMHVLEDIFEAFMGALSLEATYEVCKNFFVKLIEQEIDFAQLLHTETNFKDILLQFFHRKKWHDPKYGVLDISGPDHKKIFTVYVKCKKAPYDDGEIVGVGHGTSKKKGEQEAAKQALLHFGIINENSDSDSETCESFSDISDNELDNIEIIDDESADDRNYKFSDDENTSKNSANASDVTNIINEQDNDDNQDDQDDQDDQDYKNSDGDNKSDENDEKVEKFQCDKCDKMYKKEGFYKKHIKKCLIKSR